MNSRTIIFYNNSWVSITSVKFSNKCLSRIGHVCAISAVLPNGCCDQNGNSTHRFYCLTCRENRCCHVFEHCISCCLQPHKVIILLFETCYLTHFFPNAPVLYPLKTSENLMVFWCFQGYRKGTLGTKGLLDVVLMLSVDFSEDFSDGSYW